MKIVPVLATITLVAGSVAAATTPASAAFQTECDGEGADVTIPGDLVVPAGAACNLINVSVTGNTIVRRGADLVVTGGTFSGNVTVRPDGYFDAIGATVEGRVQNNGFGLYAESTRFGRDIFTNPWDDTVPYIDIFDVDVAGSVLSTGAETRVESSTVGGDVSGVDGDFTDVIDSTVAGGITVTGQESGAIFCESEVYGDAVYSGNPYALQLGITGFFGGCYGPSFWGGDVTVDDNTGGVEVSGNIVRGDLSGEGNDPAPVGVDNRIRGEVTGQFAELAAPTEAAPGAQARSALAPSAAASAAPEAAQLNRADKAATRIQRRDAAVAEAAAAGKAF